jgi:hypothetical protein
VRVVVSASAVLDSSARMADSAATVLYTTAMIFMLATDANFSASTMAAFAYCRFCLSKVSPVTVELSPPDF